jgi:hypothetical protein
MHNCPGKYNWTVSHISYRNIGQHVLYKFHRMKGIKIQQIKLIMMQNFPKARLVTE